MSGVFLLDNLLLHRFSDYTANGYNCYVCVVIQAAGFEKILFILVHYLLTKSTKMDIVYIGLFWGICNTRPASSGFKYSNCNDFHNRLKMHGSF